MLQLKKVQLGCRVSQEDEDLLRRLVAKTNPTATVSRVRDEDLDIPPQELGPH